MLGQLGDRARIRTARVHPVALLAALRTYAAGHGVRGLLALDVSGSMRAGYVASVPGLTPRDASAALALVTAATEERYEVLGFCRTLRPLSISPRQRLDDAVRAVSNLPFGRTDCALPMLYAQARRRKIDIADPTDPEMLDVAGFDTATPQLISDFARGAL